MNDIEFIETLKQKRNACDYSQSRLATPTVPDFGQRQSPELPTILSE